MSASDVTIMIKGPAFFAKLTVTGNDTVAKRVFEAALKASLGEPGEPITPLSKQPNPTPRKET